MGTTRIIQEGELPKSIDEVLVDFTNISRAEAQSGEDGEEDEEAYTEVVEYLRAAVQLIHDELEPLRNGEARDPAETDPDSDFDSDFDVDSDSDAFH
jgi:uncharacterized protein YgfB (UPF0149 family)